MKKIVVFLLTIAFLFNISYAQQILCGFDKLHEDLLKNNLNYKNKITENEALLLDTNNIKKINYIITAQDTIYEIPVVIHILHSGEAIGNTNNPSDQQIKEWITYLNNVYTSEQNGFPSASNGGTRIPVRFVLAKRSPTCMPTTGIVRVDMSQNNTYNNYGVASNVFGTPLVGLTETQIRNTSRWNPEYYYNIYIVNKFNGINATNSNQYLAGFAYLAGVDTELDGAFMLSGVAQAGNTTLPHEMGHALGLYHTFQGESNNVCTPNNNCNAEGDKVCDTEPVKNLLTSNPLPTNTTINPCTNTNYAGTQYNFMGYGSGLNHFSLGQKNRIIRQLLLNRANLLSSITSKDFEIAGVSQLNPNIIPQSGTGVDAKIGITKLQLNDLIFKGNYYEPATNNYYINTIDSCMLNHISNLRVFNNNTLYITRTNLNRQYSKIYIDWNNNSEFDESTELVYNSYLQNSTAYMDITSSIAIEIPSYAQFNIPLFMRTVTSYEDTFTANSASIINGQVIDFMVNVQYNQVLDIPENSFTVNNKDCKNYINWNIKEVQETNVHAFVEKSNDGINFESLIEIEEHNSADTYEDRLINQQHYYRIKFIYNNIVSYSKVIKTNNSCNKELFNIFPNPTKNYLNILADNITSSYEISIYDLKGSLQLQQKELVGKQKIAIQKLIPGNYVLIIKQHQQPRYKKIFTKI